MSYLRQSGDRRVVITGMGTINPIANSVPEFWDNLARGKGGVRKVQNFDLSDYSIQIAAEVDFPADLETYFRSRKLIRRLDRYIIHAHVAGTQAMKDSGLDPSGNPFRYGAIIGSGDGGIEAHGINIGKMVTSGPSNASPFYIVSAIPNTGSAFVCQEFGLMGPSFSVNSACATANHAIGISTMMIRTGIADAILAGGSEAAANRVAIPAFGNIMALATRNDDPATASRPFDRDRNGFVMGEGAGVLVLEALEHAVKRGAKIYAEVTGVGFTSDAYDFVAPHPEGIGAAESIRMALSDARIDESKLDLINCHGTSTQVGDRTESVAINRAIGSHATRVRAHSTKSMIGHLLGGASSVEAIAAIMAFERGIIHPTINQFNQDPDINLNVVKEPIEDRSVNHILSNAFGFGGHNAVVVFSRFDR